MSWKRGLFRAYVVLAVLFVAWATWRVLNGNQKHRSELSDECVRVWLTAPAGAERLSAAESQAGYEDCIAISARASPLWGEVIVNDPRRFAIAMAVVLGVPVAAWWLLRGLVALAVRIARGLGRDGVPGG